MFVIKRDGSKEQVKFEKVSKRITRVAKDLKNVDPNAVAQKVIQGIYDGVSTVELDKLAIEVAYSMTTVHYEYDRLAVRLAVSNLHKNTPSTFSEAIDKVYNSVDVFGKKRPLIAEDVYTIIKKNAHILDSKIDYDRDYLLDYFGFKTLERSYLLKTNEYVNNKLIQKIAFRPQHLWMMVSVGIHKEDIDAALETYEMLSKKEATHATPTLFNAGLIKNQLSSCFAAGTQVFTFNDGSKNIENVKVGDIVLTHKGNLKKVLQVHKNLINERQLYKIKAYGSKGFIVTDNHRFWSSSKEQISWSEEPQWNEIKYLREGDFISVGSLKSNPSNVKIYLEKYIPNKKENSVTFDYEIIDNKIKLISLWQKINKKTSASMQMHKDHNLVNSSFEMNSDFAYLLGVWLGDGHMLYQAKKPKRNINDEVIRGIAFTFDQRNVVMRDKILKISNELFGVNAFVTQVQKDNCQQIIIHSKLIGLFFRENFGRYSGGKHLNEFVYNFSRENVISLFEGLMTSDGCFTKAGELRLSMCNDTLIKDIFMLGRAHNMDLSYSNCTLMYKGKEKSISRIAFPKGCMSLKNIDKYYIDGRLDESKIAINGSTLSKKIGEDVFVRIQSKEKIKIDDEYVYTLGVEDDHSYMIEGLIAENCFLIAMKEDSIPGIYDTLKETALISQSAGGIGLHIHDIRCKGSAIFGTGGTSNGIIPMLKNFHETAKYVDQGGGKRKGSFAIYLEPWHADIFEFLDLRKNNGKEELRARDLNLALWVPDLFFNRVKEDGKWTLIDPTKCPNLSNVYGEEFNKLYIQYEQDNMGERTINARDLWSKIVEAQIETGQPYMLAKDACNMKSNQKNLGTIKSSNLCSEIIEYSDAEETAVCNLASISLPSCVDGKKYKRTFNFQKLYDIAYQLTINLNKVIDVEFYPVETAKKSNLKHRPIGIGIQGLADVFALMRFTWDSPEALLLNQQISETMYYAALTASADLAKKDGAYESYPGSPLSEGIFQFDMWNTKPTLEMWDWEKLKKKIKKAGVRNSLLLTNMPTASTSNIMGNTECFEPITSNIYTRQTLSGEFAQVNKYLLEDLVELNIWNDNIKQKIIASNGSIQNIVEIPDDIKALYKTVWEISQRVVIDMAAARGPFVCQSQSMNLYIKDANTAKVTSALFYAWEKGLKTLVYYLRSNAARETTKFTVSKEIENQVNEIAKEELIDGVSCSLDNPETCESCSG